jgi:regulator of cell morphogenesis and NO signaling
MNATAAPDLTARMRIGELLARSPVVARALHSIGLDPAGKEDWSLGQLAFQNGFNAGILLMIVQSAIENAPREFALPELQGLGIDGIIRHIEETHHAWERLEMPALSALVHDVTKDAADERLVEAGKLFATLVAELEAHLLHEEDALFPMARELATTGSITTGQCGGSAMAPVACMEREHDDTSYALRRLRHLTSQYAVPTGSDARFREMMERLARFDEDLEQHMYKENKLLFPRVLDADRGARRADQPPVETTGA